MRNTQSWLMALLSGFVAACQAGTADPPSVCPGCEPRAGGETSDFGGEWAPCEYYSARRRIEASEANSLGYDAARLTAQIERRVDASLFWTATATKSGGPASGFDPETRVRVTPRVTSFTHVRIDPERCDGTTCRSEEVDTVVQAECRHRLEMGFEIQLHTEDGALSLHANGIAVQWAGGLESDAHEDPIGVAYADLRSVTGDLRLTPDLPEPYVGRLIVELLFRPNETEGALWPKLVHRQVDENGITTRHEEYSPLKAEWPRARAPEPPSTGGEEGG
jgi:hypothetical protein